MSFFFALGSPVPPTTLPSNQPTGGGGTFFPRYVNRTLLHYQLSHFNPGNITSPASPPVSSFFLFPNDFDHCLAVDYKLYDRIDPTYMSCAKKPECFLQSERDWVDAPKGGVVFNPVRAIPLPAPADGDVTVLSMRVPIGYDGIITAQFHTYTELFEQGSGDLVWRIKVNGRYLRDCGEMLVTLGSVLDLSPVYGGLQLRSGNLVEYIVSAPNAGGSAPPPGTGNVITGLHGWFYPRK